MFFLSLKQLPPFLPSGLDAVELRLDLLPDPKKAVRWIESKKSLFYMITLLTSSQGGAFPGSSREALRKLKKLTPRRPGWINIQYPISRPLFLKMRRRYPNHFFLLSHHFADVPPSRCLLDERLAQMQRIPADHYKIVIKARSFKDSLTIIDWRAEKESLPLTAFACGKWGESSRLLSGGAHSLAFGPLTTTARTAPGQLSWERWRHFYPLEGQKRPFFAVIGRCEKSIAERVYHAIAQEVGVSLSYFKIPLLPSQLTLFIENGWRLGFRGLSVTTPLKKIAFRFVTQPDALAKKLELVNSIKLKESGAAATMTDGIGLIAALAERGYVLEQKSVVIVGAGAVSEAVAVAAMEAGARVTILARNPLQAEALRLRRGCAVAPWGARVAYDFLINSSTHDDPVRFFDWQADGIAIDVNNQWGLSSFLKRAQAHSHALVEGKDLFIHQGILQWKFWTGQKLDALFFRAVVEKAMQEEFGC